MKKYLRKNKGMLALCILLGGMGAVASSLLSIILQKIINAAAQNDMGAFMAILYITIAYLIALCFLSFAGSLCGKRLIRNMTVDMRTDIFDGIINRSPKRFYQNNYADYISALTNDTKLIEENFTVPLLMVVEMSVMFLATMGILFYLSPLIAILLIVGMFLMFTIPALLGKMLEKKQEQVSLALSEFTVQIKDYLAGFEVIRGFRLLPFTRKQYEEKNRHTADVKYGADKVLAINEGLSEMLSLLTIIIVVFVASFLMMGGKISVGTLIALIQLSGTFMTPVIMIMQNLPKIKGIKNVVQRVNDFSGRGGDEFSGTREPRFDSAMEVKRLTFSYDSKDSKAVNHVNLRFEKGKKYALTGHSGSGKSTLIKLLTGYSAEYDGEIIYDGVELKELDVSKLSDLVSTIHQNVYLFDTTIRENIQLSGNFSEDQWKRALSVSGVGLFIDNKEGGLDYKVGDNGNNLSGGQKQRVAVARAVIRNTPVIILDEGTSSIDTKTAVEIENSLLAQENLTIINITHNVSPENLGKYDEVIVMENGNIQADKHGG